ncbi:MAG: hypothetical protein OCD76_02835 [Reichenbachiella sp.]
MKYIFISLTLITVGSFACMSNEPSGNRDFNITKVEVTHREDIAAIIWQIEVEGQAGGTTPLPIGSLHDAPVESYVFPTSLDAEDVGFGKTEGIVALALTSHPDFDDTPLWDENSDKNYANDGIVWHPHWVILVEDERVDGGLSVKQFVSGDTNVTLPPTNPGMPMYMDSPGFQVITNGNTISVVVPDYRINNKQDFYYDGVAAHMRVNTEISDLPMLGVYEVYSIASGDLSLPYQVK